MLESHTLRPAGIDMPGLWRCIDRAPDGGWWLQPADTMADWWTARHGRAAGAESGMVNVHQLRLVPHWLQLQIPDPP